MQFDIIFIDVTAPKPYYPLTLQTEPLGGSEATMIRVAEYLAHQGLKVGVFQQQLNTVLTVDKAFYLPIEYLDQVTKVTHVVSFRGIVGLDKFPQARKYSWHEDLPTDKLIKMSDFIIKNDVLVIAASKWHKTQIQNLICNVDKTKNPRVTYIYNPLPEEIYRVKLDKPINKNKLVWMSSPHKGLDKALEIFKNVKDNFLPDAELQIFNPGYLPDAIFTQKGVRSLGALPCGHMWEYIKDALCVFYPNYFQETFGCVAAEANAVGVPVLTYSYGALSEIVPKQQLVPFDDRKALIDKLVNWHNGYRPEVYPRKEFNINEVGEKWLEVLTKESRRH